jgi:biotin transport system substrate-specific component
MHLVGSRPMVEVVVGRVAPFLASREGRGGAWWAVPTLLREALLVLSGTALVALCAQVMLPFQPVPVTLQTFAVLLIGATFGARRAALTMLVYLLEGAAGLPVFAGAKAGAVHLFGPTGGYLLAFPLAAFVVGWLVERGWDRRPLSAAAALLAGDALILACGVLWLAAPLGLRGAAAVGLLPFIIPNLLKLALASALLPPVRRRVDALTADRQA